ncbi:MAG: DEAD/DEAH box helicase family protein [Actinomycetota bacterium]|nr:DEAD/DEAH box helicase family protein [Actinomycetota bacterium]
MPRSIRLRPWQKLALERFGAATPPDFLAVATPGAGKTTFALAAARLVLARGEARRLIVVVPTAHLKRQWARAAAALDLHLETNWAPGARQVAPDMHGIVTTYQQVATQARALSRVARDAFVVLDEVHHAGDDRAWGTALRSAFSPAARRLSLSGTPFRSDTVAIPFINYDDEEARPDFEYDYGEALSDRRVVRPIYFPRTNGYMEWQAPDGSLHAASFDDPLATSRANQRLRTAISLEGEWLPEVLGAAHDKLSEIRAHQHDAAGLVIAADQEHARGIAELLRRRFRTTAVVATSDDPLASARIARFADSDEPWLVAVRMVSEGVDLPRLRVGVFATTTTTELFFRQAVGRFVRWTPGIGRQPAYLYIPDDARLRRAAAQVAERRRHCLRARRAAEELASAPGGPLAEATGEAELADEQLSLFSVISAVATDATLPEDETEDDEIAAADDDPSLVLDLPSPPPLGGKTTEEDEPYGRAEAKVELRRANLEVARAIARSTGRSHAEVNAELNRLAGLTSVREATADQLRRRLEHAARWQARLNVVARSPRRSPAPS